MQTFFIYLFIYSIDVIPDWSPLITSRNVRFSQYFQFYKQLEGYAASDKKTKTTCYILKKVNI